MEVKVVISLYSVCLLPVDYTRIIDLQARFQPRPSFQPPDQQSCWYCFLVLQAKPNCPPLLPSPPHLFHLSSSPDAFPLFSSLCLALEDLSEIIAPKLKEEYCFLSHSVEALGGGVCHGIWITWGYADPPSRVLEGGSGFHILKRWNWNNFKF